MTNKQDVFATMNEFYAFVEDIWTKFTNFNQQIIEEYKLKDNLIDDDTKKLSLTNNMQNRPRWYKIETAKEEVISIIDVAFKRHDTYLEMPHGQNLKSTYNL